MKEAEQDQGPNGCDAGAQKHQTQTRKGSSPEKREESWSGDTLHHRRSGKPADHESQQMKLEKIGCVFFWYAGNAVLRETDNEAGYPNLGANVKELGKRSFKKVFVRPQPSQARIAARFDFTFFPHFRQVCQVNQHCDKKKQAGDHEVRYFDGGCLSDLVRLQLSRGHGGELRTRIFHACEDECCAHDWRDDRSDRIEGLREVQASFGAFRRAENGYIWVCGDFQNTLTAGHHKQGEQEEAVQAN